MSCSYYYYQGHYPIINNEKSPFADLQKIITKVTFFESERDAESIALPIDHFETLHVLTIFSKAITLLQNNEIRPIAD